MRSKRESSPDNNPDREPFTTIDDLVTLAHELVTGLHKLAERKHPLAVRRGTGKEVINVSDNRLESRQVKAGSKTYFIDVEKTKEDKPYLRITESRFKGEGADRERSSIVVFAEHADEFVRAVREMALKLD